MVGTPTGGMRPSPPLPEMSRPVSDKDLVLIESAGWKAQINPLGAELTTLWNEELGDLLWVPDPTIWTGISPILFPVVGKAGDGSVMVDGQVHPMASHGFARKSRFDVSQLSAAQCRFILRDSAETREAYPFAFELTLDYTLGDNGLTITAGVNNSGGTDLVFSLGFHPAFRWPLDGETPKTAHDIRFEADDALHVHRLTDAKLLGPQAQEYVLADHRLCLDESLFVDDAMIILERQSQRMTYGPTNGGRRIAIETEALPHLGLWMRGSGPYVCIEPWQGYSDPEGFAGELTDKPGTLGLAPGHRHEMVMRIALASD